MGFSSSSTSYKAKSLITHIKCGKYFANIPCSSSILDGLLVTCICLLRFTTRDKLSRAFSSIAFIQLKRKYEESKRANEKIFISICWSLLQDPRPSVSMSKACKSLLTLIGLPQIQSPLVQDYTVAPISKPSYLPNSLLRRKLFPVL